MQAARSHHAVWWLWIRKISKLSKIPPCAPESRVFSLINKVIIVISHHVNSPPAPLWRSICIGLVMRNCARQESIIIITIIHILLFLFLPTTLSISHCIQLLHFRVIFKWLRLIRLSAHPLSLKHSCVQLIIRG